MKINGIPYRSVWVDNKDGWSVHIIDQTRLPFSFQTRRLTTAADVAQAICTMQVRGAPLIGAVAAYGIALALRVDSEDKTLNDTAAMLMNTRPTAVNLHHAIQRMVTYLRPIPPHQRAHAAYEEAARICEEDIQTNKAIGTYGLDFLQEIAHKKHHLNEPLHILTHCNAGWLATVDYGTALSPIYMAHDAGLNVHVWVDETRPRNQGSSLTAWELQSHGVPHTVITDNAGGHLMQHKHVDIVIVGADRVTRTGDVANKIGTYLKALAARDNAVPFWVALPSTTIDWTISDGLKDIPIEERSSIEVTHVTGRNAQGLITQVCVVPEKTKVANPAFDVTPAHLITGLITEKGCCAATPKGMLSLFPEMKEYYSDSL
ncbi:MAG: S-methyl-5-thioribose-1-phosphate isomerase [Acetobacter sp.]|nr:S-methyl-5-thioribose-1-phosphate isomerase [Acetobacter sp.]